MRTKTFYFILFGFILVGNLYAQRALEVDPPSMITEEGYPGVFAVRITNLSVNSYNDLTLQIVLGDNWEYISNSEGYVGSVDNNTVTLTLPSLASAAINQFTVQIQAKCGAEKVNPLEFVLHNAAETIDSELITSLNLYRPILLLTASTSTLTYTRGTPLTRTFTLTQREMFSHFKPEGLRINVTLSTATVAAFFEITKLEFYNGVTAQWEQVPAGCITKNSQTSYTYTFTASMFEAIGNRDNRFDSTDGTLQLRETIEYTECNTVSRSLSTSYTPQICGVVQNGPTIAHGSVSVGAITAPAFSTTKTLTYASGTAPSERGKSIVQVTGRGYPLISPAFRVWNRAGTASGVAVNLHSAYVSDVNGNSVEGAPALTVSKFNGGATKTATTQGDTIKFPAGYEWNLTNGAVYYITYEWDMTVLLNPATPNLAANFAGVAMTSTNGAFQSQWFYSYRCLDGGMVAQNSNSSTVSNDIFFELGWMRGQANMTNNSLNHGSNTTLVITDPYKNRDGLTTSWPNNRHGFALFDTESSTVAHKVVVQLPSDLVFTGPITITGSATPGTTVTVDPDDITYDVATNTITFRNSYGSLVNNDFTYTLGVQAIYTARWIEKKTYIRHVLEYDGQSHTYAGFEYNLYYSVWETGGINTCTVYSSGFEVKRTTFGYEDLDLHQGDTVRITSEARAVQLGVNQNAAGPHDNVRFNINLTRRENQDWISQNKSLAISVVYSSISGMTGHYFRNQNGAEIRYKDGGGTIQTILIPSTGVSYITKGTTHRINIDLTNFMETSDLDNIYEVDVNIFARTSATLPTVPERLGVLSVLVLQNELDCEPDCDDTDLYCGRVYPGEFVVWDYKLADWTRDGTAPAFANALNKEGQFFNYRLPAENAGNAAEVFTNEFRPNAAIVSLTTAMNSMAMKVHKVYDNQGKVLYDINGSPRIATITHPGGNTNMAFTGQRLLTNEQWNTSNPYLILGDWELLCGTNWINHNALTQIDYPTSEQPTTRNVGSGSWRYFSASITNYSVSLSVTPTAQMLTNEVSWVVTITNSSSWRATDKKLPNFGIALLSYTGSPLTQKLDLFDDVRFYDYTGGVQGAEVVPTRMGDTGYAFGTIETTEPTGTSFMQRYLVTAKVLDCTQTINTYFDFSWNYLSYPTGGTQPLQSGNGFYSEYGNRSVCTLSRITSRMLNTNPVNFSSAVNISRGQINGRYNFCDSIIVENSFSNNLDQTSSGMSMEVHLSPGMYLDPNTPVKMYFGINDWSDINSLTDFNGTIIESTGKITFTLDLSVVLQPANNVNRLLTIVYGLRKECGFRSGLPLTMTMGIPPNPCSMVTQGLITAPIRVLDLGGNDNPVINFRDNMAINPTAIHMTGAGFSDEVRITGTIHYIENPTAKADFRAVIPKNMELVSGTLTDPDGAFSSFAYDPNTPEWIVAEFSPGITLPSIGDYEIDLTLRLINPEAWTCGSYDIILENYIYSDFSCPDKQCMVSEVLSSEILSFTLDALDIAIDSSSVLFTERAVGDGSGAIDVRVDVVNNSSAAATNAKLYIYAGSALATGNTTITVPTIPANSTITVNHTFASFPSEICDLRLVLPGGVACNPDTIDVTVNYDVVLRDTVCQATDLVIGTTQSITGYTYTWTNPFLTPTGLNSPQATFNVPLTSSLQDENQRQIVEFRVERPGGCTTLMIDTIHVVPAESTWEGDAALAQGSGIRSDWHNVYNWSNGIPDYCTNVLIPGRLAYYPDLTPGATVYNEYFPEARCNYIHFEHGGEVYRTDSLHYTKAFVDMEINSNQWYMLSAPLKNTYSGDFYVHTSNPHTDLSGRGMIVSMMRFGIDNPQTGHSATHTWTKAFNTHDIELQTGQGFALFANPHSSDYGHQYEIGEPFCFPKNDPFHHYYYIDGTSAGRGDDLDRTYIGRFIYEDNNNKAPVDGLVPLSHSSLATDTLALIGNPFMAHLDFEAFYNDNSTLIYNEYKIAYMEEGDYSPYGDFGDFRSYKGIGGYYTSSSPSDTLTQYIHPMQSFLVYSRGDGGQLVADIVNHTTVAPTVTNSPLRSSAQTDIKQMFVTATRGKQKSSASLVVTDEASPAYSAHEDSRKLFDTKALSSVLVYLMSSDNIALDIHTTNDLSEIIPVGIRTDRIGRIVLNFSGMEAFEDQVRIYLHDTTTGDIINLFEQDEYAFMKYESELHVDNRFYLSFQDLTGISNFYNNKIVVNSPTPKIIQITSISGQPIENVEITDIQGRVLIKEKNVQKLQYSYQVSATGVYIVRVMGETKKVIVK
jgi:hypothetical protein